MSLAIHITDLIPGNTVRIALRPGRHLEPRLRGDGTVKLRPGSKTGRSRAAKGFSRTTILAQVVSNDSVTGVLNLTVTSRNKRTSYPATITYADIQYIQLYVTPSKTPFVDETRAQSTALGVGVHIGLMNLIPVRF